MASTLLPSVRLASGARDQLARALARGARDGVEPCGYLLGHSEATSFHIQVVRAGSNQHLRPQSAFHLAAEEHLRVRREAAGEGLSLLGIWHGHRGGAAEPSQADQAGMTSEHPVLARRMPALMLIAAGADAPGARLCAYVRGIPGGQNAPRWTAIALAED
jgi:proteasome lid subunit RPN8/RPN11